MIWNTTGIFFIAVTGNHSNVVIAHGRIVGSGDAVTSTLCVGEAVPAATTLSFDLSFTCR